MTGERILIIENESYSWGQTALPILSNEQYEAESVKEIPPALEKLGCKPFDLILMDLAIPGMDGLQFLRRVHEIHGEMPAIVMADSANLQKAVLSLKLGVQGFLVKPFTPQELLRTVRTTLQKTRHIREGMRFSEAMESVHYDAVKALAQAIEAKDHYTGGHCDRIVEYARAIGEGFGLPVLERKVLAYAAALHDIGKIGIPETILNKPGKLTEEEYTIMKTHPEKGAAILRGVGFLAPVVPLVYYHQERYDGQGYPDGLAGERIPLGSRIVAVLDTFDAMTSDRPYRKALPLNRAIAELNRYSGQQFDPLVVDVFLQVLEGQFAQAQQPLHPQVSAQTH